MTVIIDNEANKRLSEVFENEIKKYKADSWRLATGFFFFDGWKFIRKAMPKSLKKFYLLFGYTDELVADLLAKGLLNDEEIIKILSRRLAEKLSDEVLEELSKEEELFRNLIEAGVLKTKWLKNLHAKLYLFTKNENDPINFEGRAIVGSSNITGRGFDKPGELNVFISDVEDVKALLEWFNRRWAEAKEITPEVLLEAIIEENSRRRLLKSNAFIDVKKYHLTVLDQYLFLIWYFLNGMYDIERVRREIGAENKAKLLPHNRDPVLWGYYIIKEYNGVILADPVGLGKSFQALGILASLRVKDNIRKALFIVPPHLIVNEQWVDYIKEFFPVERVYEDNSIKNLGIATHRVIKCSGPKGIWEILLISSYGLARVNLEKLDENNLLIKKLSDYDVLVIDEAHHFKNINSKKRRALNEVIRAYRERYGKNPYTILLTATPILNEIGELLSLVSIYTQGEGFFDHLIIRDPEKRILKTFEMYERVLRDLERVEDAEEKEKLVKKKDELLLRIRDFVKNIMIMRSRSYIEKKYFGAERPKPKLKVINMEFKKEKELMDLLDSLHLSYLEFSPSSFVVLPQVMINSEKNTLEQKARGVPLQDVIRILLAKRLESSTYALFRTLSKIMDKTRRIYDIINELRPDNIEEERLKILKVTSGLSTGGELFSHEELPGVYFDERIEKIDEKLRELLKDRKQLEKIKKELISDYQKLNKLLRGVDIEILARRYSSKEEKLIDLLDRMRKDGKKVVIFSMFKDTVNYLYSILSERYGKDAVYKVTGDTEKKKAVIESFREPEGSFSVLVATDSISEGINLEFVDFLINYDIPWTPAVIMQRVGRLWRINRKSSKEYLFYNFIPPEELVERYTSILGRIEEKLSIVKDILILEIKLLKEEDELTEDFEERIYGEILKDPKYEDVREVLQALREGKAGQDFISYLYTLLNEEIDGISVKERIREKEKEFEKILEEIERGKVLNLYTEGDRIKIFRFTKRYWLKGPKIIDEEGEKIQIFQRKWKEIMKNPFKEVSWKWIENAENFVEREKTRFKNIFMRKISEDHEKILGTSKSVSMDLRLLLSLERDVKSLINAYMLPKEELEELQKLRKDAFFILFYALENKFGGTPKATRLGQEVRSFLREIGVIKNQNLHEDRLNTTETLRKLIDKFGREITNEIRLEVIF